jgi:alpha-ketoglutarate-dependent taurine dioxygenase
MAVSAKASVLAAHVVPPAGGETEWADMRAAYEALPAGTRARIDGLSAFHSIRYAQAQIGHEVKAGASYGMSDDEPPFRPLVKTHPVTGRKSLFIGRHAFGIPGLSEEESKRLLAELTEFACQPPRVYRHAWAVGDVALWDNRCLLHRARPYDTSELRVLWHVRVAGDPVSERALNK